MSQKFQIRDTLSNTDIQLMGIDNPCECLPGELSVLGFAQQVVVLGKRGQVLYCANGAIQPHA